MSFIELLQGDDTKKLIEEIDKLDPCDSSKIDKYIKEYEGEHKILSKPNKQIENNTNMPEDKFSNVPGETTILSEENVRKESKIVFTAKNVFTLQKVIIEYAMMFLFGSPAKIRNMADKDQTKDAFQAFKKLWRKTKCDSLNMRITREMKIKKIAMEQWFWDKDKGKLRVGMFTYPLNTIIPVFNMYGDLAAIVRKYTLKTENNKESDAYEILTDTSLIYLTMNETGTGYEKNVISHGIGKIPAVFWHQPEPDWVNVQGLIDRLERSSSGHSDTNDYNVDPVLGVDASVLNMPGKDERGKVLTFDQSQSETKRKISDMAAFIEWNNSIDSMKYEHELLQDYIFKLTFTPDVTPEKLKGMGNISRVGIEMLFFNSILKAKKSWQEHIEEYLERRASVMIEYMKIMPEYVSMKEQLSKLEVEFEMGSVLPRNVQEMIDNVTALRPGKTNASLETALSILPYDVDVEDEAVKIRQEESENSMNTGESFNL